MHKVSWLKRFGYGLLIISPILPVSLVIAWCAGISYSFSSWVVYVIGWIVMMAVATALDQVRDRGKRKDEGHLNSERS